MNKIENLEREAALPALEQAATAMVELARLYGEGDESTAPDLFKAWNWAKKAAELDSPDGYLEISKIIGSACIATSEVELKKEYARYVVAVCDPATLTRFDRPDIARNIGTVAEYMRNFGKANRFDPEEIDMYHETATRYYQLAHDLLEKQSGQQKDFPELKNYISRSVRFMQYGVSAHRPVAAQEFLPYRFGLQ